MTNKEDEENASCEPRVAALLAVRLVSQVLDEAFVIVNAAKESGHPWQYVTSLKNLRSCRINELYDENMTFLISNDDSQYVIDNNIEDISKAIVTSTPQKDNANESRNESSFMGQGDEEFELSKNQLRKSTSMFINHLFDMSDVEHVNNCGEDVLINNSRPDESELLIENMSKIMESCVNAAFNIVFKQENKGGDSLSNEPFDVTDTSSYSFLSNAKDNVKHVSGKINDTVEFKKTNSCHLPEHSNKECKENVNKNLAVYENAYMTLNRDYEQYSEEDELVLQDPKTIMPMQEIKLLTANTSTENINPRQIKREIGVTGISTSSAAASRKNNLVRRCRIQGARLLSCLRRWWWRRKLPDKRKDQLPPASIRGLCPITPNARRRAASLLDQRNLLTPSPSKSLAPKFNTVNEAIVHSSRWKEYVFQMKCNENEEF